MSKAQALTRFRQEFAELANLAEGFEDNPFPASIEVRVGQGAERDGRVDALVKQVVQLPGVVDVRYDRDWLARVGTALDTVRAAGFALALLMGLAAAVTVATVVRLGLLARHDEIEIMELVGAPLAYIRGPFVAEGLLAGRDRRGSGHCFSVAEPSARQCVVGDRAARPVRRRGPPVPAGSPFCGPDSRRDVGREHRWISRCLARRVRPALTEHPQAG